MWVEQANYSTTTMVTASVLQSLMRFSQGFIDLLRLGEEVSEGTVGGVAEDVLRLLIVGGPLLRLGSRGVRLLRAAQIQQASGTFNCSWVAALQATRRAGYNYFLSLRRLFRLAGFSEAEAATITQSCGTSRKGRQSGFLRQEDWRRPRRVVAADSSSPCSSGKRHQEK